VAEPNDTDTRVAHRTLSGSIIMTLRRFLVPALSVLVLACSSLAAHAQTGPVTGGTKKDSNGPIGPKPGEMATVLSVEKVTKLLQAKGGQTTITNSENANGKFTFVQTKLTTSDFMYDFAIVFANQNNGNKIWYMTANLNPNGKKLTADQMQGLLKENFIMSGDNFFMIDPQTGALLLQSGRYGLNFTDQVFERQVNVYLDDIKATYKLWAPAQ
jgi:hypothetical protein